MDLAVTDEYILPVNMVGIPLVLWVIGAIRKHAGQPTPAPPS